VGGGPCKGRKPVSEGTGRTKARLTRSTIDAVNKHKKSACYRAMTLRRLRLLQVATPGHRIYCDGES